MGHGHFDVADPRNQDPGLGAAEIFLKIAGNPLFKVTGLTHINDRALSVLHTIYPRLARQGLEEGFRVKLAGFRTHAGIVPKTLLNAFTGLLLNVPADSAEDCMEHGLRQASGLGVVATAMVGGGQHQAGG